MQPVTLAKGDAVVVPAISRCFPGTSAMECGVFESVCPWRKSRRAGDTN